MLTFPVDGRITTFALGNPMVGYPKIISSTLAGHDVVVRTPDEMAQVEANDEDMVIEPVKDTVITVNGEEHLMVLGRDYSSCVIRTGTRTIIVGDEIPQPDLEVTFTAQGYPRLRWTSAFLASTRIYRTEPVEAWAPNTEHTLIAEIDEMTVPNVRGTYTDTSNGPIEFGHKVSYYVVNSNGTSNAVEVIR